MSETVSGKPLALDNADLPHVLRTVYAPTDSSAHAHGYSWLNPGVSDGGAESLCAAAGSSGATAPSTSGHGSSPATPAPGVPTADCTERPLTPRQIVPGPAGAPESLGGRQGCLSGRPRRRRGQRHRDQLAVQVRRGGLDAIRDVVRGAAVRGMAV